MSRFPRLLMLAVVAVVILGCTVSRTGGGGPTTSSPAPSASQSADDFQQDVNAAVGVAEQYWRDRFTATGRSFQPIRQVIPYRRAGEVVCGTEPLGRNNAAYCSAGDFIAFDVNWALAAYDQIGDAFIYYMLDHEYAHGIQVRFGLQYRFTIEQELQADCMAGATLGDSIRANRLSLEDGDIQELQDGLAAVADDPGQPWFAEGAHGSAQQRTDAFFAGYRRSIAACDLTS
jgi:uncharacterized protein